jgi:hypothetical protein
MTHPLPGLPAGPATDLPVAWIRAVAEDLAAAGLVTAVRTTRAGLDVTASIHEPAGPAAEVILDEAGYAELRWWIVLTTSPAEVTAIIARVLDATTPVTASARASR